MNCYNCGFWDSDYECCTCPSTDKWYACPLEPAPFSDVADEMLYEKEFGERRSE